MCKDCKNIEYFSDFLRKKNDYVNKNCIVLKLVKNLGVKLIAMKSTELKHKDPKTILCTNRYRSLNSNYTDV